jgi:hypothetical protein
MHNEELHDLYSSSNTYYQVDQIEETSWAKSGSWMVVFVGKTGCRRPLGRWEEITMDLEEIGW